YDKVKSACITCHDKSYGVLADGWQNNIRDTLTELEKLYAEVSRIKTANMARKQLLSEAKLLIDAVNAEKSRGAHNPEYADTLLSIAKKKILAAEK
ncbi:MAG: hypothetical protein QME64_07395, partial [bacterium]|nr:hypothetical protein [bacterium]